MKKMTIIENKFGWSYVLGSIICLSFLTSFFTCVLICLITPIVHVQQDYPNFDFIYLLASSLSGGIVGTLILYIQDAFIIKTEREVYVK